ncbi:phosphodiesterase [Azospirillum halopraeferens]|uniref:phosphodiesterase n=1 Tax=Azospirillum halopraeferens TaxID=34010 RepID=UPI000413B086|nr:phosphodiesterase [Azospirillum halopraeferens]
MLIAQITDLHVTPAGTRAFGRVDTNAHLAAAVAHLNALDPRPDLVLITGDLANTPKPGEYEMLEELLAPLTLPCRVLPGNHDDRSALRRLFPYLPAEDPFLHHVVDEGPLRILMLDSQKTGFPEGELCAGRLAWIADRLAEEPGRPTLIAMHHQPFPTGLAIDTMGCAGAADLADLVRRSPAPVVGIVCGHVHRPITAGWAGTTVFCAPSTAHQFALDLAPGAGFGWTTEPPAVALHRWVPDSGLVTHLSLIGDYPRQRFG